MLGNYTVIVMVFLLFKSSLLVNFATLHFAGCMSIKSELRTSSPRDLQFSGSQFGSTPTVTCFLLVTFCSSHDRYSKFVLVVFSKTDCVSGCEKVDPGLALVDSIDTSQHGSHKVTTLGGHWSRADVTPGSAFDQVCSVPLPRILLPLALQLYDYNYRLYININT